MAGPAFIRVDDAVKGSELARCLGGHGLIAGLVRAGTTWQVEVSSLGDDARSFFADLGVALADWSGPRGRGQDDGTGALPHDTSARWADALRGDGAMRDEALRRVRAYVTAATEFELRRRGIPDGVRSGAAASLVRETAERALGAILTDLDQYRGQSAFTTWTAKYAIHEAAAAARAGRIAGRPPNEE